MIASSAGVSVGASIKSVTINYDCPSTPISIIPIPQGGVPLICSVNSWTNKQAQIFVQSAQESENRKIQIAIIY